MIFVSDEGICQKATRGQKTSLSESEAHEQEVKSVSSLEMENESVNINISLWWSGFWLSGGRGKSHTTGKN